jgi:hypothetical protein
MTDIGTEISDSLVLEMNLKKPVGSDKEGEMRIKKYLTEFAALTGMALAGEPLAHLSPKFGYSGFAATREGAVVHMYAWDDPPFMTIDFYSPDKIGDIDEVIRHTCDFFGSKEHSLKNMHGENSQDFQVLSPKILRQRLGLSAPMSKPPSRQQIEDFSPKLADVLNMNVLAPTSLVQTTHSLIGFTHWETSGTVIDVPGAFDENQEVIFANPDGNRLSAVIYTCKAFDPEQAKDFLERYFGVTVDYAKSF